MTLQPGRAMDEEEWYHGVLPRDEVQRLLQAEGDYLVRQSNNRKTGEVQYVLSVYWTGGAGGGGGSPYKHFIIQGGDVSAPTMTLMLLVIILVWWNVEFSMSKYGVIWPPVRSNYTSSES